MRVGDVAKAVGATPSSSANSAAKPGRAAGEDAEKLREACRQFEAVFLAQLLQKMRDTVPEDPLLGESSATKIYYSMLDWEMAQQMARTQSIGLADMLYRQLSGLGNPQAAPEHKPGAQPAGEGDPRSVGAG